MRQSPEDLRRRAERLRRDFTEGSREAVERVRAVIPEAATLRHDEALHVIAREEGHPSWRRLELASELALMDRSAKAERLKYSLFLGQHWVTEALLRDDADLPAHDLGLQCAIYDLEGVKRALAGDAGAATRTVGVRSPILHLAFSRHFKAAPERADAMIAVAEALVEAGADVNDSYPAEPGSDHRLSALYGALGHAGNLRLAEWLLDRGADPDDSESLYHATELGHLDGLKLLMRHDVSTRGTNALIRMLDFDDLEGARLLLDYGADPNEAVLDHPSGEPVDTVPALHQAARRGRDGRFARLLLDYGADATATWQGHSAYALARMYGNVGFADALRAAGHAHDLSAIEAALATCADGGVPEGQPLARLQPGTEAGRILTRIILWEDCLEHARRLVAAGIDPNVADEMGMTPLHLAGWAGLPDHVAWLLTLDPDLDHVNAYGGDLVGTIVHGSENRLDVEQRDHVGCGRLALDAGAPLRRSEIEGAMHEGLSALLRDWAAEHPERVVESTDR